MLGVGVGVGVGIAAWTLASTVAEMSGVGVEGPGVATTHPTIATAVSNNAATFMAGL